MCWQRVADVLETNLRPTERLLLFALAHRAHHETGQCYPSLPRLEKDTGLCRRAIQGAVKGLLANGHISRWQEDGKKTIYSVHPQRSISCTGAGNALPGVHDDGNPEQDVRSGDAADAPEPSPTSIQSSPNREPNLNKVLALVFQQAEWRPGGARLIRAREHLRGWIAAGYDLQLDILPAITRAVAERPGPTNSLKRFDTTVARLRSERTGADLGTIPNPKRRDEARPFSDFTKTAVQSIQWNGNA